MRSINPYTKFLFISCLLFFTQFSIAQQLQPNDDSAAKADVFTLGEVVVTGSKQSDINNRIYTNTINEFNRLTVSGALNLLPGIILSNVGARNESMVYVRGYDLRQVPVYIDGIPVYVPYDGYADLARFTTFDLAEIKVEKGFSSVMYGPNALGGAINLITKKPLKKFELNGSSGWLTGGYQTNINIGANFGKLYIQAGFSKLHRDYYVLSDKFDSVKNENGDKRENSYNNDIKYNIKIAFTPNKNSEYAVGYVFQQGKKGTPVYAGSDTLNSLYKSPRYWQWPKWNKQTVYFISTLKPGKNSYIKTRAYYDEFVNQLFSYDDNTYTTQLKPYAFQSYYNDYTIGASAEYGTKSIEKNDLKFAVHFKQDVHREHNLNEPVRTLSDNTFSIGAEEMYAITDKLNVSGGISYNKRSSLKAQDYNSTTHMVSNFPSNNNDAVNAQAGLFYAVAAGDKIFITASHNTRFATSKDRYSYRLGTAIPNPNLQAESAMNYEAGYSGTFHKIAIEASLFYNRIHNTIQLVNNVEYDSVENKWLSQQQNTGKAKFYGTEAGLVFPVSKSFITGINYTYIQRNNISNPTIYFINVPKNKLFGYVQYSFFKDHYFVVNAEYNSNRYSTTYGTVSGAFTLVNIKAYSKVWKYISAEAGINNLFDRNYTLAEGYPEAGRNYFINIIYNSASF